MDFFTRKRRRPEPEEGLDDLFEKPDESDILVEKQVREGKKKR